MKTRKTKKKLYISNYIEMYKVEMANTIFTEESQMKCIEYIAKNDWEKRKKDVKSKADALLYGILDSITTINNTKETMKKALN